MQGKKFHQLPHTHLQPEFLADQLGSFPADPGDLRQPDRLPLHDSQSLVTETVHDPGSHFRSDALDDPAGQVCQDLHTGLGQQTFQKFSLKLTAVAGMIAPSARDHQTLTHGRHRNGANHGHALTAAHRQPQYRITVFIILIYHRADGALNDLKFFRQIDPAPFSVFCTVETVKPSFCSR